MESLGEPGDSRITQTFTVLKIVYLSNLSDLTNGKIGGERERVREMALDKPYIHGLEAASKKTKDPFFCKFFIGRI